MGFDSLGFFFLLYAVVCLFWYWRASPGLLLAASLLFYASFDWRHLLLLAAVTLVTHFGARWAKSRWALRGLLAFVFAPLVFWKTAGTGWAFPLGLSFYTFHCASYLIDVARGTSAREPSLPRLSLYVAFFPQLVAGPITRAREMLPQFARLTRPGAATAKRSAWRIYLGLLKKLAVANVLGVLAREVLTNPQGYHGYLVLFAIVAGRYYIFADFSGYTDIAIGAARLLGVSLPENFRRPFAADSLADYWRRWHITLQAWIRDYVFFPLAASPVGALAGTYPLVLLTFALLGAWHGLSWNFLLYGLWHGTFLVLHDATRASRNWLWDTLGLREGILPRWLFPWATFFVFVCPPTILFLTRDPAGALAVVRGLAHFAGRTFVKDVRWYHLVTAELTILFLEVYQWLGDRVDCFERFERLPRPLRWAGVIAALAWLGFAGEFGADLGFLYFQF